MRYAVVLLCAGKGIRLKSKVDKAFVRLGGVPLFYYSYRIFKKIKGLSQIVIVAKKKYFPLIRRKIKDKRLFLVEGGRRRQDSVYKGLLLLQDKVDYVFVHDGARPFVTTKLIERLKREVLKSKAVVPALKVSEAIKSVKRGVISRSLDRSNLWFVQTPQVFKKGLLFKAHKKFRRISVYDDAELVGHLNKPIRIVEGERWNIKITYPEDLILARAILRIKKVA